MFPETTYRQRRQQLLRQLADSGEGTGSAGLILILGQDDEPYTFAANLYPFRQDSSFLYYFGLSYPGLAGLLDLASGDVALIANPQDEADTLWFTRPSPEAMAQRCGIDRVINERMLGDMLLEARRKGREIHYLPPYRAAQKQRLADFLGICHGELRPSGSLIRAVVAQREVKSAEELAEIDAALAITERMHGIVRQAATSGVKEAALVHAMSAELARSGARMAYAPICTRDGHILHQMTHDNSLRSGDFLLVDAGAEVDSGYASDITRTHCVDEAWTDERRLIYATVKRAQEVCVQEACPGMAMAKLHRLAARVIVEGLVPLKLFHGSVDAVVETGAYALVFPHGLGHLLGLDVHDMESLGEDAVGYDAEHHRDSRFGPAHLRLGKRLRQGMVITIEPGIYFIPALWQRWQADDVYRDMIDAEAGVRVMAMAGVRIEDNFVIEPTGARRLGPAIPS
ncbi:MAG: aminopeptidase P N-terminal domain-containing protein [Proteobacteria bacterium]|nr:aminopeptidase P N-terminal domain-containing protein [Pseudomonadota bacterium]